jgi:aminopeptidase N
MRRHKSFFLVFTLTALLIGQQGNSQRYSRQDSVKGSITPERAWWNLLHYDLEVDVDPKGKFISGVNKIRFEAISPDSIMQLDLMEPMKVEEVKIEDQALSFKRDGDAFYVTLPKKMLQGESAMVVVHFKGRPKESINPPWDGGFIWSEDRNKKAFVANAVQLIGPSVWFPSKDHPYDEPDEGVDLKIICPSDLIAVGNGRLIEKKDHEAGKIMFHWRVTQPINGYGINVSIGDYTHFSETYAGEKGDLTCDYYVLKYNLDLAREQFKQVPMMLEAFEHWFGPYPFYEDGFKLLEVPYLGMEHQSAVTYGNEYQNGYLGGDLSSTGWGLKFDFIIVHESGHEWFANSITNKDVADMWIHEGFTNYSETLYLDYHFGTEAGNEYLIGVRELIKNEHPIIGDYGVNSSGSTDMYYKGGATLHTLRQIINDDEAFRKLLRDINREFYHSTVSSSQVEEFIALQTGLDLKPFFDQYLRTTKIPRFQYRIQGDKLTYRFKNIVEGFHMPLRIYINDEEQWIHPNGDWQELSHGTEIESVQVDPNFYVRVSK